MGDQDNKPNESENSDQQPAEAAANVPAEEAFVMPETEEEKTKLYNESVEQAKVATDPADAGKHWGIAAKINPDKAIHEYSLFRDYTQARDYVGVSRSMIETFKGHEDAFISLVEEAVVLQPENEEYKDFLSQIKKKSVFVLDQPVADPDETRQIAIMCTNTSNEIVNVYGDLDAVLSLRQKAVMLMPEEPAFRGNLAFVLYDQERFEEARTHLDYALERIAALKETPFEDEQDKKDFNNLVTQIEGISGIVSSCLGRHEEALLLLKKAEQAGAPLTAAFANAMGNTLASMGHKDDALLYLRAAADVEHETARKEEYVEDVRPSSPMMT